MSRRSLLKEQTPSKAREMGIIFEDDSEEEQVPEFRTGEIETVNKVLERIDQVSAKRVKEGFSKRNFQLGKFECCAFLPSC
jgi:hypothetical protein